MGEAGAVAPSRGWSKLLGGEKKTHHPVLVRMPLDRDFLAFVLGLTGFSIFGSLGSSAVARASGLAYRNETMLRGLSR